jgi:hypothetical protein
MTYLSHICCDRMNKDRMSSQQQKRLDQSMLVLDNLHKKYLSDFLVIGRLEQA